MHNSIICGAFLEPDICLLALTFSPGTLSTPKKQEFYSTLWPSTSHYLGASVVVASLNPPTKPHVSVPIRHLYINWQSLGSKTHSHPLSAHVLSYILQLSSPTGWLSVKILIHNIKETQSTASIPFCFVFQNKRRGLKFRDKLEDWPKLSQQCKLS